MSHATAGTTTDIVLGTATAGFVATGSLRVGVVAMLNRCGSAQVTARSYDHDFILHSTSYFRSAAAYEHIDFATNAELGEIDSRLN